MIGSRARGVLLSDPAVPGKRWEGCHDLTGPRSLVCIAGELREREAVRKARAARRRRSWLFRLVSRVRDWRARRDRGSARRPAAAPAIPESQRCEDCGAALPYTCSTPLCDACLSEPVDPKLSSVYEALTRAQLTARRAGQRELADALHAVFLLDLTGNLADMAPLVASVRASLQTALGDDPRDVN